MIKSELLNNSRIRTTFARSIAKDPKALYERANVSPLEPNFVQGIADILLLEFNERVPIGLVNDGIRDTCTIFDAALEDSPATSREEALDIVRHPDTALSVAAIALHSQKRVESYAMQPYREDYFSIDHDRKKLVVGASLPDHLLSPSGCPYAGKGVEPGEKPKIDPLFKRFVPWAGTLAVLRYFDKLEARNLPGSRLMHEAVTLQ